MAELKVEDLIDESFMRKLEASGFMDGLYRKYGMK